MGRRGRQPRPDRARVGALHATSLRRSHQGRELRPEARRHARPSYGTDREFVLRRLAGGHGATRHHGRGGHRLGRYELATSKPGPQVVGPVQPVRPRLGHLGTVPVQEDQGRSGARILRGGGARLLNAGDFRQPGAARAWPGAFQSRPRAANSGSTGSPRSWSVRTVRSGGLRSIPCGGIGDSRR